MNVLFIYAATQTNFIPIVNCKYYLPHLLNHLDRVGATSVCVNIPVSHGESNKTVLFQRSKVI